MDTLLRRAAAWNRPLMIWTGLMALLSAGTLVAVFADGRSLLGVPIWLKPWKFSVSFVVYSLTLAWMLSLLPRRSRWAERAATVIVAAAVLEMLVIVGQVARGRRSHFNEETPFDAVLWSSMGAVIMVLFLAHLVIAVILARQRLADRAAASGVRLGLAVSLLGMLVAFPMTVPNPATGPQVDGVAGAHSVGTVDGGPGLPVVGWSTVGGDLRVAHFIGMHALQALPLLALLLAVVARRTRPALDEATRVGLVRIAGAGYAVLTLMLMVQALRGQPLLRPDASTAAGFAALAVATALAAAVVLAGGRRRAAGPPLPAPVRVAEPAR